MEGVYRLETQVPEVVARQGGVTTQSTRLQDLADGVALLEEDERGNTAGLPS